MSEQEVKYSYSYKIFKPNLKDPSRGNASTWTFDHKKGAMFLSIAKQNPSNNERGNATFDWENQETMSLGIDELSEVIEVLENRRPYLGMEDKKDKDNDIKKGTGKFHKSKAGHSVFRLYRYDKYRFAIEMSSKKGGNSFYGGHLIADGSESRTLCEILKFCIIEMYKFSGVPKG
jgi:hypothetical protein